MSEVIENEDGSKTIELVYPLANQKGDPITDVTITRPKVKHIKASELGKNDTEKSISLIAALTGLRNYQIESMDLADFQAVSEVTESYVRGKS